MSLIDPKSSATETRPEPSKPDNRLMLVEVFDQPAGSRFQFLHPSDIDNLSDGYRVLYHADVDPSALFRMTSTTSSEDSANTDDFDVRAFLEKATAADNTSKIRRQINSTQRSGKSKNGRDQAVASKAMDAATDAFFDLMERNIDRWTYDASSSMLSALAIADGDHKTDKRREAADIQVKSNFLNTEFRAFFIESLVCFNCDEPIEPSARALEQPDRGLEIVSSDSWRDQKMQPLLAKQYAGQTTIEYSQLNRRLNYLLERRIHPDESILGPKAIAWTLSQALAACNFSIRQRGVLEPIIVADFNSTLEKLYRHINLIWIGLDILPDTKLEIVNTGAA